MIFYEETRVLFTGFKSPFKIHVIKANNQSEGSMCAKNKQSMRNPFDTSIAIMVLIIVINYKLKDRWLLNSVYV